jgi:hypothetical protein
MTEWTSVEAIVRDAVARLHVDLDGHHQVVDLSERGEQRITAAIDWLISVRHPDGYWGYRSPAVTSTCTLAIGLWRPVEATELLRPSADWLLDQAHEGAWETVWDSGTAVAAVHLAGLGRQSGAKQAAEHLLSLDPSEATGRPHHAAQVLAAAELCDWHPAKKDRWVDRLVQDLNPKAGAYVLGQAVYALLGASRPVADFADELDELARYLTDTPPSTAAFLDRAAALRALARAGTHADIVDRTIDEFFGSAYRRDGSWYHDPWYTGWGLLALHEASAVRRVVIEQPRLDDYLARLDNLVTRVRDIEAGQANVERRERLVIMAASALLVLGLVGAALAVFELPDTNRLFSSGLAVSLLLTVVAVAWHLLWPALRGNNARHQPPTG